MAERTITISIRGGVGYLEEATTNTLYPGDRLTVALIDYDTDGSEENLHGDDEDGYYVMCDSTTMTVAG